MRVICCWVRGLGSSPRGRGKHEGNLLLGAWLRLIPARAGKTRSARRSRSRSGAHPRAGGENEYGFAVADKDAGSSPRGRGKPVERRPRRARRRLIPARAGKTERAQIEVAAERLIPARAGKTRWRSPARWCPRAHPRAGGENAAYVGDVPNDTGSSPRGRGKHQVGREATARGRLIPARAGKTTSPDPNSDAIWAHPRAGGENRAHDGGASVRAWLIPARAGKTHRGNSR